MAATAEPDELVRFAAEHALTRPVIEAVRDRLGAAPAEVAARLAVQRRDPETAAILLLAGLLRGERPDAAFVAPLLPLIDHLGAAVQLLARSRGDRVGAVVAASSSRRLGWEREAALLFLAAEELRGEPAPAALKIAIRRLARRPIGPDDGLLVGAAALAVKDEDVELVASEWIGLARTRNGRAAADRFRRMLDAPLPEVLSERPVEDGVVGHTIRREGPKVGRNDPCPCGSGRKYKACCAGGGAETGPAANLPRRPPCPYSRVMTFEQVNTLRPMEAVRLDPREVATSHLPILRRILARYGYFEEAVRALDEYALRAGADPARDVTGHREEMLCELLEAGEAELARRIAAQQPQDAIRAADRLGLELLAPGPETIHALERTALAALRDPEGAATVDFAWAVMDRLPALGLLIARGTLDPARDFDSWTLLEGIEEARDRLSLPPGDPAWDTYEAGNEEFRDRRDRQIQSQHSATLADELEAVRARAAEEAAKARDLERRLEELKRAAPPAPSPGAPRPPPPSAPAKDGSAKARIEELQTLLRSSNHERAKLRAQLAGLSRRIAGESAEGAHPAPPEEEDPSETPDDPPERPALHLPAWGDRFEPSLGDLSALVAREALAVAARIAGGGPGSWTGVKRMRSAPEIRSARLGLNHRLLFRPAHGPRRLEILEVVPRKDLETALRRYR